MYAAKNLKVNWTTNGPAGAKYNVSKKGRMDRTSFHNWFTNFFIPLLPNGRPVKLIMDGHASHLSIASIKDAVDNGETPATIHESAEFLNRFYEPNTQCQESPMTRPISPKPSKLISGEQPTVSPNTSTQSYTPETESSRAILTKESIKNFFLKKRSPILSKGKTTTLAKAVKRAHCENLTLQECLERGRGSNESSKGDKIEATSKITCYTCC